MSQLDLEKYKYVYYIDGIRAVSLFLVIIFHLDKSLIPGGFLGVDIFYVLSGYLISLSLFKDYKLGKDVLKIFYLKRIKRLYPSLFIALGFTLIGSVFILPGNLLNETLKAILATLTISSNIYFMLQGDYFSPQVDDNPLIHTWSLSVEEQFYLVFPILFIFLIKRGGALLALGTLALLSILFNLSPGITNYEFYYLTPARFYQFMLGAIVLLLQIKYSKIVLTPFVRNLLSTAIFFILGLCCLNYWESSYYSFSIRVACSFIVVLVLIVNDDSTYISKFLNHKYFAYIGKSSYTTYLLHWPVIIFLDTLIVFPSEVVRYSVVFLTLFSLSGIQYNFFEKKITYNKNIVWSSFLKKCLMAWLVLLVCTLTIFALNDNKEVRYIYPLTQDEICDIDEYLDQPSNCMIDNETSTILSIGNSHELVGFSLGHYFLKNHLPAQNTKVVFADSAKFVEVLKLKKAAKTAGDICKYEWNDSLERLDLIDPLNKFCTQKLGQLNFFIRNPNKLSGIILSSYNVFFNEHISMLLMTNYIQKKNPNVKVLIIGHLLRFRKYSCRTLLKRFDDPKVCNQQQFVEDFDLEQKDKIQKKFPDLKFEFVDLVDLFCKKRTLESCELAIDGESIYVEKFHFNLFGINEVNARASEDPSTYNILYNFFKD